MYLADLDQLRALIAARGISSDEPARQAQVPKTLMRALVAGEVATCSYGPARRLERCLGAAAGALFVSDVDRDSHMVRRLCAG